MAIFILTFQINSQPLCTPLSTLGSGLYEPHQWSPLTSALGSAAKREPSITSEEEGEMRAFTLQLPLWSHWSGLCSKPIVTITALCSILYSFWAYIPGPCYFTRKAALFFIVLLTSSIIYMVPFFKPSLNCLNIFVFPICYWDHDLNIHCPLFG